SRARFPRPPACGACGRRPATSCSCASPTPRPRSRGCSPRASSWATSRDRPGSSAACASASARPRKTTRCSPRWEPDMPATAKILFVDRDGTLIEEPPDQQIDSYEKFRLVPGAISALRRLVGAGYELVMVSNQDGLGTPGFPEHAFAGPQ